MKKFVSTGLILCISFILSGHLYAQYTISGRVTDGKNEALIGVNIMETGKSNGTVTDFNGDYTLTVEANSTVQFSYIGYKNVSTAVTSSGVLNMVMEESASELDEIVVVAYGTQRKKDLTGAVSVIDAKSMQKMLSPNIGQALQSMSTGVSVSTSGAPGSGADIRIRGVGSLSTVGPLYVIDGMIINGSQREFNLNDVESIQVLKDASATALYGARGANGVIILTTRKGQDGVTKIDFSANMGVQQIAKRIEMMNSLEFLRINRMGYENAGKEWPGEPDQGQVLINTDWQDEFMKTGLTQDYNLTVSGGNPNGRYLFSINSYTQDGVVIGPEHERVTFRVNSEARKGIFTFGENLLVAHSSTVPMTGAPFVDLARMPPVIPVYDPENPDGYGIGSSAYQTYGSNPIGLMETRRHQQTSKRAIGNIYIQLEPFKGLLFKSNAGIEYHNWFDRELTVYKQIRYLDQPKYANEMLERKGDFLTRMFENTLFYNMQTGNHKLDILLGGTTEETVQKNHTAGVKDLEDGYWVLSSGLIEPNVSGSDKSWAMISFLGRINYDYAGKYLLQFNIRRDGSSRFGRNYQYGTFPAASAGWRISEETFFEAARPVVNDLKLRFSYGILGEQQTLDTDQYDTFIHKGDGSIFGSEQTFYPGAIQKGRANPDLRWERKATTNLGLDFSLLDGKYYGSLEYFSSDSKDLLVQIPISWTSGTDETPWKNHGRILNKGLEVSLGIRETKKPFKYNLAFNFTTIQTTVLELGESFREGGLNGVNRSEKGRSVGDFYLIRTDGIFQNWDEIYAHTATIKDENTGEDKTVLIQPNAAPGDIRYKDLNHDGRIDKNDREYVGSPLPKYEAGINFSAEYKNFDFNLFIAGHGGNKIYNNVKYWLERMDETSNLPKGLKPWTPDNPSTTTPRPFMGPNDNTINYSDRWIENGDYLRIKNLQLGYSVPQTLLRKTALLERVRIYAGVQNLYTFTRYSGFDPEISGGSIFGKGNDNGHFPPVRTVTFGLQVSF